MDDHRTGPRFVGLRDGERVMEQRHADVEDLINRLGALCRDCRIKEGDCMCSIAEF
jgi:hypothetical protein